MPRSRPRGRTRPAPRRPARPAAEITTRVEAEAAIRAIPRRCRGPWNPGAQDKINAALKARKVDEARALGATSRIGCGYDFNDTIVAGPWDGADHLATCPQCSTPTSYRAPVFPGVKK